MDSIPEKFIAENIDYPSLIQALKLAFRENIIQSPPKSLYDYASIVSTKHNTLLFMPAWDDSTYFGTKLMTATPSNKHLAMPYLHGVYILFDATHGKPLVSMDAKLITNMRTAATSVLASQFLAARSASSVLVVGNGSLSHAYIQAYTSMPTIDTIYVWGRDFEKSKQAAAPFSENNTARVTAVEEFTEYIKKAAIVSCITSSHTPIIEKEHLSRGQHFDLAGSYTEDMKEVSTDVVAACSIYTDNDNITLAHAGEIVQALKEKKISRTDMKGDLAALCKDDTHKRKSATENTLFKSTGMALEDLVIARLIHKKYSER